MFTTDHIPEYMIHFLVWPSLFILSLVIFRMRLRSYLIPIAAGTFVMVNVGALLQSWKIVYLITIIQPLFFLLCLLIFFKVRFLQSILMIGITFGYGLFIEFSYNAIIVQFDFTEFLTVTQNEYVVQGAWVAAFNILLAYIMVKFRWGFTFISSRYAIQKPKTAEVLSKLHFSAMTGIICLSLVSLSIFFWNEMFFVIAIAVVTLLAFVLHYSYKSELMD
ncbi:hypothetical protein [Paenibacillus periandrae]|uniref:hypothetical protein n=1 Tax=Paenibacillus periandrae TaxID=1761741 RepID=UPI001F091C32|nr:hypothetical protein [Paenibacillus periandrae]